MVEGTTTLMVEGATTLMVEGATKLAEEVVGETLEEATDVVMEVTSTLKFTEAKGQQKKISFCKTNSLLNESFCCLKRYRSQYSWQYDQRSYTAHEEKWDMLPADKKFKLLQRVYIAAALEAYKHSVPPPAPAEIALKRTQLRENPPVGPPDDYVWYYDGCSKDDMFQLFLMNELQYYFDDVNFPMYQDLSNICDIHDFYAANSNGDRLYIVKSLALEPDQTVFLTYLIHKNETYSLYDWKDDDRLHVIKWMTLNVKNWMDVLGIRGTGIEIEKWMALKKLGVPCPVVGDKFFFNGHLVLTMYPLRPLDEHDDYRAVGVQLLQILQKVHTFGVHNSLKPENIMAHPVMGEYYLIDVADMATKPSGPSGYYHRQVFPSCFCSQTSDEELTSAKNDLIELGYALNVLYQRSKFKSTALWLNLGWKTVEEPTALVQYMDVAEHCCIKNGILSPPDVYRQLIDILSN